MAKRRLSQFDLETGEQVEGFLAVVTPKRKNAFNEWFAMSQTSLSVLKNIKKANDYRVIMALLEEFGFENKIQVSQADIARSLGMCRQNVNASIKRLIKLGLLYEGKKIGTSKTYILNPNFCWKGTAANHQKTIRGIVNSEKKDG